VTKERTHLQLKGRRNILINMKIAFIGLGNMGRGMAQNLIKAGHQLTVWNRTRSRAEGLNAKVANTPADAARDAEVTITMLADDNAVESVVFGRDGFLEALPAAATHVSMSTISVELSRRMNQAHSEHKQHYVAAPVFGRPSAAEAAKLFIVVAGPETAVHKCEPLFSAMGQRTFKISTDPIQANIIKLSGNFMIANIIESLGEAIALTRKYGVEPQAFVDFLTNSLFNAPIFKTYGDLVAGAKYEPAGFKLRLGLKDIRLALVAADSAEVPLPAASLIHDHFLAATANGMGDLDWSALALLAAKNAGLKAK
jgi:3-hydroxyisobutyrate dehydrogenase-like beta-hydroxyacid dehydrogenase